MQIPLQKYGAVQWIGMHRGRVQEYKERHLSCQQLAGPLLLKTERLRTKSIIFRCFVLLLFGNCLNRKLRFFLEICFLLC